MPRPYTDTLICLPEFGEGPGVGSDTQGSHAKSSPLGCFIPN